MLGDVMKWETQNAIVISALRLHERASHFGRCQLLVFDYHDQVTSVSLCKAFCDQFGNRFVGQACNIVKRNLSCISKGLSSSLPVNLKPSTSLMSRPTRRSLWKAAPVGWMEMILGRGCWVFVPPSIAMPREEQHLGIRTVWKPLKVTHRAWKEGSPVNNWTMLTCT